MFARRFVANRLAVLSSVSAARFQSQQHRGGRPTEQQIRQAQAQQQQQMQRGAPQGRAPQQQQQMPPQQRQQAPPAEEEEEDMAPPTKPENSKWTKVDQRADGVAVLKMARAPVNSLNLEMFEELIAWYMWLSTEESGCKAIVLTSELSTVFSAGLDINELNKPEPERFQQFWFAFQEIWLIMNTFPKPIIASINGNSPAGGCVLSLCCDYRIMARASLKDPANPKPYRIGLNETKLGIVAPPWVMRSLAYVVGDRKAERMLQLGETPTADEALAIGLVDKVVEETEIQEAALQEAAKFVAIPNMARMLSKDLSRQHLTSFFREEEARQYDGEFFANLVQNPEVAENVSKYLARLGGGKK